MNTKSTPGTVLNSAGHIVEMRGYGNLGISPLTGVLVRAVEANPKYVGFVIGHKGHYINAIKQTSGAWVQIRDAQPEHGRPSSWFEIQGYPHQVEAATHKVMKALDDALIRDKGGYPKHTHLHNSGQVPSIDEFPLLSTKTDGVVIPTAAELDEASEACEVFENEMDKGDPELQKLKVDMEVAASPSYTEAFLWAEEADLICPLKDDGSMSEFDHARHDAEADEIERDFQCDAILHDMVSKGDVWVPPSMMCPSMNIPMVYDGRMMSSMPYYYHPVYSN